MLKAQRTAFAVVPHPVPRKAAATPESAAWTLYDPRELAQVLGLPVDQVDRALERTGFNKAVRIREEVIRWKERLRHEERDLRERLGALDGERDVIRQRLREVGEQLENTRNILRIPREKAAASLPRKEGE